MDKNCFDNSDYLKDSKFYDGINKKVIGKFKDEIGGKLLLNLWVFEVKCIFILKIIIKIIKLLKG